MSGVNLNQRTHLHDRMHSPGGTSVGRFFTSSGQMSVRVRVIALSNVVRVEAFRTTLLCLSPKYLGIMIRWDGTTTLVEVDKR